MNRPLPLRGVLPDPSTDPSTRPRFALGKKGFRPLFFLASLFAALIVPLWLLVLGGVLTPAAYLEPLAWHAHEMVFGYSVAVIAGFLLTAVANWTQRETLTGAPLLALASLWALGRIAMLVPAVFPRGVVALLDLAFLPLLAVVLARPLIATRSRRNFVMLAVLAVLTAANAAAHLEALGVLGAGTARHACRIGVDVIVFLMLLVTGRVVPMFTRNATNVTSIASRPVLERLTLGGAVVFVALDAARPDSTAVRVAAALLAVLALARAAGWGTRHTLAHPLLWILHAGYAWIPVGLVLRAAVVPNALHALTAGAIGALTIGMMARVTLGHTGRPLVASPAMTWSFAAILAAAVARVGLPLLTPRYADALAVAGVLWTLAFLLLLVAIGPALLRARIDGKAG